MSSQIDRQLGRKSPKGRHGVLISAWVEPELDTLLTLKAREYGLTKTQLIQSALVNALINPVLAQAIAAHEKAFYYATQPEKTPQRAAAMLARRPYGQPVPRLAGGDGAEHVGPGSTDPAINPDAPTA